MAKIPEYIRDKLRRIMNHQIAVKDLVRQVEQWAGIAEVFDDEDVWNWAMTIDQQGAVSSTETIEEALKDYMALKVEQAT